MSDIHDKIRKLLAMAEAQGGNENEMANAMKMASDLMMRHGIEREQLGEAKPKVIRAEPFFVDYRWHIELSSAAASLCGCKILFAKVGDVYRVRFVGRPENTSGARDIYTFLALQLEFFYKTALPKGMSKGERAEYRRTFKAAFCRRVWQRALEIINTQPKETGTALMVIDHRNALLEEAEAEIANVKVNKTRELNVGRGTWDGVDAGNKADLNRKMQPEVRRIT